MDRRICSFCVLAFGLAALSLLAGCAATKPADLPGDPKLIRDELSEIQNEIAHSIAKALRLVLTEAAIAPEARERTFSTTNRSLSLRSAAMSYSSSGAFIETRRSPCV